MILLRKFPHFLCMSLICTIDFELKLTNVTVECGEWRRKGAMPPDFALHP